MTGRRWAVVTAVAAAVAVALSVVLAMVANDRADLEDEVDEGRAVARVAGEFAAAVAEFDPDRPDAAAERVRSLTTRGFFESEYEVAMAEWRPALAEAGVVISTTVQDVFIGSVGDDEATAIVELDLMSSFPEGSENRARQYLLLNLVHTAEGWRVEAASGLGGGATEDVGELLDPAGGAVEGTPPAGEESPQPSG